MARATKIEDEADARRCMRAARLAGQSAGDWGGAHTASTGARNSRRPGGGRESERCRDSANARRSRREDDVTVRAGDRGRCRSKRSRPQRYGRQRSARKGPAHRRAVDALRRSDNHEPRGDVSAATACAIRVRVRRDKEAKLSQLCRGEAASSSTKCTTNANSSDGGRVFGSLAHSVGGRARSTASPVRTPWPRLRGARAVVGEPSGPADEDGAASFSARGPRRGGAAARGRGSPCCRSPGWRRRGARRPRAGGARR